MHLLLAGMRSNLLLAIFLLSASSAVGFVPGDGIPSRTNVRLSARSRTIPLIFASSSSDNSKDGNQPAASTSTADKGVKKDNKAMAFLRKVGRVGGRKEFVNAVGSDEGPAGKASGPNIAMTKCKSAFKSCVDSGIIDDMSEAFPYTTCGTTWRGFTDQVMGGVSYGRLEREEVHGRQANVLHGKVSLYNNGGFVQMATDLSLDPFVGSVDATAYDGIELDVLCQGRDDSGSFNVHVRNPACQRQNSSYRATFELESGKGWKTVRLPWDQFRGFGTGPEAIPFDVSELRRIGIVAIGRKIEDLNLALSGLHFYSS